MAIRFRNAQGILMIKLKENALKHLTSLTEKHDKKYVRLSIKGGGCAGFGYEWTFENEHTKDDLVVNDIYDTLFRPENNNLTIYIKVVGGWINLSVFGRVWTDSGPPLKLSDVILNAP